MRPPVPCATICRATCWLIRNGPVSVTASTASHCSLVMSKMVLLSEMAALLTRMSMRPNRVDDGLDHRRDIGLDPDIGDEGRRFAARGGDGSRDPVAAPLVEVDHRHPGAFGRQGFGDLLADVAPGAGDDRHLVGKLHVQSRSSAPARAARLIPCRLNRRQ